MDLYREQILDHYKHPRNFGNLIDADVRSEEVNISCGDKIHIDIKFHENQIQDIRFSGEGCAINQAAASMLTEKVKELTLDDVMKLDLQYVEALLGTTLTPSRIKCAMLPLEAIQKAIWTQTTQKLYEKSAIGPCGLTEISA